MDEKRSPLSLDEKRQGSTDISRALGQADWLLHTTRDAGSTQSSIQLAVMKSFSMGCLGTIQPHRGCRVSFFWEGREAIPLFTLPWALQGLVTACLSDPHPLRSLYSTISDIFVP